jgi:hypothetical protein
MIMRKLIGPSIRPKIASQACLSASPIEPPRAVAARTQNRH